VKRQIMGREVVLAITDGKIDLRPFSCRTGPFDGRRQKRVLVKVIGEWRERPACTHNPSTLASPVVRNERLFADIDPDTGRAEPPFMQM
jgi:hypothetical protein